MSASEATVVSALEEAYLVFVVFVRFFAASLRFDPFVGNDVGGSCLMENSRNFVL